MNKDILDYEEEEDQVDEQVFYKKSKKFLRIAVLLLVSSLFLFPIATRMRFHLLSYIGSLIFFVSVIISLTGFINGIRSYTNKEKSAADRFLILIGNLFIFGLFVSVILANVLDIIRLINN